MSAYLKTIEIETGSNPQFAVIWLHGLGANANDFVPLIPELKIPPHVSVRFIFPDAPHIPVTINGGYVMPAWYDILELSTLSRTVDQVGIQQSVQHIARLIDKEKQRGIEAGHIFLAGFSQGGAIAYQAALTYPERLAGIMALSTYIPDTTVIEQQFNQLNQQLPVYIAHGLYDNVVSPQLGRKAFAVLEGLGCTAKWHEYPMEHQVCLEEINDISRWLLDHIDAMTAQT